MKIFLLCKRDYTNKDLIQDRFGRLYHLPIQLLRLGAKVTVIAIDYRHPSPERHELEGVTFHTLPTTPIRLPGSIFALHRAIRINQPDLIIASGDSHIGYLGLWLAHLLGIPSVFDVYDYYPTFTSNRIPGMKTLFRKAVAGADLVLCASKPLMRKLSDLNKEVLLIENGVDRKLFRPRNQSQAKSSLGIAQKTPLLGYFGSISPARGPLLIEACRQLRAELPTLELLLAGPAFDVPINEPWIRYQGRVTQAAVADLISACDLVTVPYADNTCNAMSGACKIAEYLSCQKPVVATDVSGHREIFRFAPESLCKPNSRDMAEAIRRQLAHPRIAPFPDSMGWESIGRTLFDAITRLASTRAGSSVMQQRESQQP